ncbi:FG-GAP and VCBS repeat-containing protein [Streptomyces sp. NPDC002490]|uniref:FG-GAP and VCBS repeat-containing protein n=1 Tax=Streptomyces sp. NPDC002490 TaxID=3154416 RepID=UPI003330D8CD
MHPRLRLALATATTVALTGGLLTAVAGPAAAAPLAASDADFNDDGYADVAVSASAATVAGHAAAGQIVVIYGGRSTTRKVAISQNTAGVPGSAEKEDRFGGDTAYGDFDKDGYDDLAVGALGEDLGSDKDGGTVIILWGSASGLKGGSTVVDPRPTKHDRFGRALEAADFDKDGRVDLAIASRDSATVDVLRGGFNRSAKPAGRYTVTPAIFDGAGDGVQNLHSGDANGDGREDLIVNGYSKSDGYNANYWLPGSSRGATTSGAQKLPAGIITDIGDTNHDGFQDIVFGINWDSGISGSALGGRVMIAKGTRSGPAHGQRQSFTQNTPGVPGGSEKADSFGTELDLGDVNGDKRLDLVIGAPGEDLSGGKDQGTVTVLYGAANGSGISTVGARSFSQNTPGVPNSDETGDFFGSDVHVDDLDGDGRGDVLVGAVGEDGGNGAVYALRSQTNGTFTSPAGIYVTSVGVSTAGSPRLGNNFSD